MSEKRFTFGAVSPNVAMIKDNGEPMDIGEVVGKLNEQQATTNKQKVVIDMKDAEIKTLKSLNKQQAEKLECIQEILDRKMVIDDE